MEKFIIYDKGISKLDLTANYNGLGSGKHGPFPPDCFVLNNHNKTMSVLKHIKNNERSENLCTLAILLDRKINKTISTKGYCRESWCFKCNLRGPFYDFDENNAVYKDINMNYMNKCVKCIQGDIKFSTHIKYSKKYEWVLYGNNYVNQNIYRNGEIEYYIFTKEKYIILSFDTYNIRYHYKITLDPEEKYEWSPELKCTVCGIHAVDYWKHNETCIKNINNFALQINSYINWLMRSFDNIPNDIKNLITMNLIMINVNELNIIG